MENYHFSRSGDMTLCFYKIKSDMGFIGVGEHADAKEAERLAYGDAVQKARVISMKQLRTYRWWKDTK